MATRKEKLSANEIVDNYSLFVGLTFVKRRFISIKPVVVYFMSGKGI